MDNKKVFKAELGGVERELAVLRPGVRAQERAQLAYSRKMRELLKPDDGRPGALCRAAMEGVLREQKLWDDERQKQFDELNRKLLDGEKALKKGGIKLADAREIAVQMRRDRWARTQLLSERNSLEQTTAEAQAENARFQSLVVSCVVFNDTGKPAWKDVDAYLTDESPAAGEAARVMGNVLYGLDDGWEKKLPENLFLLNYGLANEDLHLVDFKGRLVDAQGRLVDGGGRLVNDRGELVDAEGNLLTEDGEYKVEFSPFISDTGEPVLVPVTRA